MASEGRLDELRAYCLAFDGAWEDHPWGETVFKWKNKVFAFTGETRVTVKSSLEKQAALIQHPHIVAAPYVGRYGWVAVDLADEATFELAKDLIAESYASVAKGKRAKG